MRIIFRCAAGLLLAVCLWPSAAAQTTRVRGRVVDAASGAPIPFVSVLFPCTTVGMTTDADGAYALEIRDTVSRIEASCMGYQTQQQPVTPGSFNRVDFQLRAADIGIEQVVITPGENPAHPILKEAVRRKDQNDPDRYAHYAYSAYTKMELDWSNFKPFKSKSFQRDFGFVFNYVDTSALTGRPYLPVMISETKSDRYISRNPSVNREIVRATRISGVENLDPLAPFTGQMQGRVNFYSNFIDIFNTRFASPLADNGLSFYNYFLIDSLQIDGRKTYLIRFHPKRTASPVLDGEIRIDSATYALRSVTARMPKSVNVNWLNHLMFENENRLVDSVRWFRSRERVSAEFSVVRSDSTKVSTFIGTREVHYSDVQFDTPFPPEVFDVRLERDPDSGRNREEAFWQQARPYALSAREEQIYAMVDSVQRMPLYRTLYGTVQTLVAGYYHIGTSGLAIGPYFKLVSFNKLEGFRPQIGGRTTRDFSLKVRLGGYVAYGTRDEAFKGGGSVEVMFSRQPVTRKLTLAGKHDVMQLGQRQSLFSGGDILSSIFSRGAQRLSMVDLGELTYEHEWRPGVTNTLHAEFMQLHGNRYVPLVRRTDGEPVGRLTQASVQIGTRLSKEELVLRANFEKSYVKTRFPVGMIDATAGYAWLPGWRAPYCRLEGGLQYRPEVPPLGYMDVTLQAGHIFGTVPYPLLKLQEGNGTYFYNRYAFACMNFYEFATDSWVALFYEHHLNGWLLGRIPLLKRLQLREVLTFRGVWGTLSPRNDALRADTRAPLHFPVGMTSVEVPYLEAGAGIENIFRFFRVDCIWRLTHRSPQGGGRNSNFSVNIGLELSF